MGRIFGRKKQPDALPPEEQAIAALRAWEDAHFPGRGSARYADYRTETGQICSLRGVRLDGLEIAVSRNESADKTLLTASTPPLLTCTLPTAVRRYREAFARAVGQFRANRIRQAALDTGCRNDPLFEKIAHVFCVRLSELLHELTYLPFENAEEEPAALRAAGERLNALLSGLKSLNRSYVQYMYSLTRAGFEDTALLREEIRIAVEAMHDVTGGTS